MLLDSQRLKITTELANLITDTLVLYKPIKYQVELGNTDPPCPAVFVKILEP